MSATAPALPEQWEKVLSRVERMLEETLAATFIRPAAFDAHANRDETGKSGEERLMRMDELADELGRRVGPAEACTTEVEISLSGNHRIAANYLAQVQELRQKVARATGRAIG